jgi:predicted metal-dependent peptidase
MSGSISNEQASDFITEVKGIMQQFTDFKINIWCFDTKVYNHQEFTSDNSEDIDEYQVVGGGGTLFEANWDFMKSNDIEPKKFIMFTDGYPGSSWGDEDYCDTLFIIHGTKSIVPPFGQVAYYDD